MTPSLAGFVACAGSDGTGERDTGERDWDEVLDGVVAALQEAFKVEPDRAADPGAPPRRTWLDTFDWRLYRAGLVLEYVAAPRGGQLILASRAAGRQGDGLPLVQPVTGWQAARPVLADKLPGGPVQARIAALAYPRALLPLVTVASPASVTRLLNDDGKTVARVIIERPVAAGTALPPRVTVGEVRGYPAQARRAARIIAACPGIEPPPATATRPGPAGSSLAADGAAQAGRLLTDALRAIGRQPGDYSDKAAPALTAGMPAPRAVAAILLGLLDTLEANVDGVLRDIDSEYLHDLRVAVRRTRAAIKLLGDVLGLDDADYDRFAAEFKWLGDLTTPVRDLDVHLLGFAAMSAGLRAAPGEDLQPFRAFLAERRVRERRVLVRGLRSARFTGLTSEWRAVLAPLAQPGPGRRPARAARTAKAAKAESVPAARELAVDRTGQAFRKVARRGGAITPESPPQSLHDLRKRCKELRYALEFFAPLHDRAAYAPVVGDLKKLQDCLGDFQDGEVQIEEIRALATAMQDAGPAFDGAPVPVRTLLAMGELTAGLAASQAAARDAFAARFASFAGPSGQRHLALLLKGERNGEHSGA